MKVRAERKFICRIHYASNSVPCHKLRIEDGLFIATRQAKPEHLLKKPLAWSYNVEIIEALKEADVDIMEVVYEDKVFLALFPAFTICKKNESWLR